MARLTYIIGALLVFGFLFFVGMEVRAGVEMDLGRGIPGLTTDALNLVIGALGENVVGLGLMALAIFGGIWSSITIWRSGWF